MLEDGVKTQWTARFRGVALAAIAIVTINGHLAAQKLQTDGGPKSEQEGAAIRGLQEQVQQLRSLVESMRSENAESRSEMQQLRQELQATRALLEKSSPPNVAEATGTKAEAAGGEHADGNSLDERVQKLEDSTALLGSKIDEQYQTKVETASKYRARLHGIVLMNASRNV